MNKHLSFTLLNFIIFSTANTMEKKGELNLKGTLDLNGTLNMAGTLDFNRPQSNLNFTPTRAGTVQTLVSTVSMSSQSSKKSYMHEILTHEINVLKEQQIKLENEINAIQTESQQSALSQQQKEQKLKKALELNEQSSKISCEIVRKTVALSKETN